MPPTRLAASDHYARLWRHVEPAGSRQLLIAALEEFAARGFHASTTREIANRIGMSPAAIYVHYKSKGDLLFEITRIGHESLFSDVKDASGATDGDAERVRAFVETFSAWHARYHTLARVTQYETRALKDEQYREIRRLRRKFVELLDELLEQGERSGAFNVIDRAQTVTAILSLGIDVARWYGGRGAPTPDALGQLHGELAVRMLAPTPVSTGPAPGLARTATVAG